MKTTNYEISKELAEAGFEQKFPPAFYHVNSNGTLYYRTAQKEYSNLKGIFNVKSYDLETILEALPKQHDFFSRGIGKYELRIWYHEGKAFVGYQNYTGFDKVMTFEQEQNESIADTAARLLILLHEKGLVNFNEEKQ